jgi:hypothetical protein
MGVVVRFGGSAKGGEQHEQTGDFHRRGGR